MGRGVKGEEVGGKREGMQAGRLISTTKSNGICNSYKLGNIYVIHSLTVDE